MSQVRSKPRHGEPVGEVRGREVFNSRQQQQLIDDLVDEVNALRTQLDALQTKVDTEHP